MQKHTKIKDVTWWLLAADNTNRLLALKKLSVKKKVQIKMQIDLPEDLDKNIVNVYLLPDCYVGLDQIEKVKFKVNYD